VIDETDKVEDSGLAVCIKIAETCGLLTEGSSNQCNG
jgi:hypothetical protein